MVDHDTTNAAISNDSKLPSPVIVTTEAVEETRRDEALDFLAKHKNEAAVELSKIPSFTRSLRRKIDWRVMPFLSLCYTLNYIDKVALNYAKIMGLPEQLHLIGDNYSNASSSLFIAVLLFSLPNMLLLNRLPVSKCLGVNLLGWGLCTACHAALNNYTGLVALRVLSGAFESGIPPALMLLTSQYFTFDEQATRFAYFCAGTGNGQILGAIISFGFQNMSPTAALSSWKTMFLVLGLITVLLGVIVIGYVPDTPMKAKFMSDEEKVALLEHVKINQTGINNKNFHLDQLIEGLTDLGCWGIFLLLILQTSGSGVITAYSATILTSFGYTPKQSALLSIPNGAVTIGTMFAFAFFVRNYGHRWLVNVVTGVLAATAAALLSFLPLSSKGGLLFAMYLINILPGSISIVFQWLTCNTAGHTKRTFATAGMNAAFAIGNIIGPLTFRAQDAPEYKPAKVTLLITLSISVGVSLLCLAYYFFTNGSKDRKRQANGEEISDAMAYAGLTDKQNPSFRYHL